MSADFEALVFVSGFATACLMLMLVTQSPAAAKRELFRDIANQRCAEQGPYEALISADNPYRYVCVLREPR